MSSSAWWQECLSFLREIMAKVGEEWHGETYAITNKGSQGSCEKTANHVSDAVEDTWAIIKGAAKKLKTSNGHG